MNGKDKRGAVHVESSSSRVSIVRYAKETPGNGPYAYELSAVGIGINCISGSLWFENAEDLVMLSDMLEGYIESHGLKKGRNDE